MSGPSGPLIDRLTTLTTATEEGRTDYDKRSSEGSSAQPQNIEY